ncbi:MAG: ThiF family adenylyltransferase [Aequorivita sp.]
MDDQRYSRHLLLPEIGIAGQQKLLTSKVLVIGAGGLGCPLLQYLVAGGVGYIGIVDHDTVEKSNLIRQVLFGTSSLGKNKALAAKQRLNDLNPDVCIEAFSSQLTSKNALDLFKAYDIIVDGTDNFNTRYLVNDACVLTGRPLVSGSLYKFEGQVGVFNFEDGPTYRCAYPEAPKDNLRLSCSELGVLGVLPGIIGNLMANEIFKVILGIGEVLSGKILLYSALSGKMQQIGIPKRPEEITKVFALKDRFTEIDYHTQRDIGQEMPQYLSVILSRNMLEQKSALLVDINKESDFSENDIFRNQSLRIPFGNLRRDLNQLDKEKIIIITSVSDVKNEAAYRIFKKMGFDEVYVLEERTKSAAI